MRQLGLVWAQSELIDHRILKAIRGKGGGWSGVLLKILPLVLLVLIINGHTIDVQLNWININALAISTKTPPIKFRVSLSKRPFPPKIITTLSHAFKLTKLTQQSILIPIIKIILKPFQIANTPGFTI